ncbi:cupin domain-containing protein [Kitasatospora sp. NBC_01287]|uniref:cupin domain-containing protein n=1 Tax=Kitasatospora sp. NBC_01287 TaxID=2903573 RepID=UPI00225B94CE|nr:cupin domain-containing protein [Kitasatospora sp. NBC_01287]MCX4750321.1 cupin domain-containing protein [Kitasatospora sp. NBC_01287]
MSPINVFDTAAALPRAWRSQLLGQVGTARLKVLRMDELPVEEEVHAAAELLFVLDGRLELHLGEEDMTVRQGEVCEVPAGVRHAVRAGSAGTLVILEVAEPG